MHYSQRSLVMFLTILIFKVRDEVLRPQNFSLANLERHTTYLVTSLICILYILYILVTLLIHPLYQVAETLIKVDILIDRKFR